MTALGLRTRLTIWFAASILLILAPFLIWILALQWQSMRAALDHHLEEDLEFVLEMLVVRDGAITWRTEAQDDPGYDAGEQRWVEVYAHDGTARFRRGLPDRAGLQAAIAPPLAEPAGYGTLRTPAGAFVRTLIADRQLGPETVRVRVARAEDQLRSDLWWLGLAFGLAAPLAVLAAAMSGYFISGKALAPLGRMADRARAISGDRLSERLPVENPNDELGQLASVFNDTFARIEQTFAQLRQFTADASHELRTPLTAIRSVGEVGLREAKEVTDYQEIVGSMLEEADRLSHVVETLLTLSRWESGRVLPRPDDVDLGELVRDVAAQLAVLAEERGIAIDVAVGQPLRVTTDHVMARQACCNVLDNAIKYTRDGGRIRIGFASPAGQHQLIVDDEGPGIPEDQRQRVLERFYRIEGGHPRGLGGAGLGLAIVHWAMTANGGRVAIGDSDGGGARVVLAWPASHS
ncbi:MAG: ATP-binding protein [Acidobacteriota bacterium]|nr:ATP-binding protein [Acidobacteriota bacterium]